MVQKPSRAVPWHSGSLLPLPAPHFEVSSPAEEMTAACEAVSKPRHFRAQCKPALSSIYLHMPAKNGASSDASQSSESLPH